MKTRIFFFFLLLSCFHHERNRKSDLYRWRKLDKYIAAANNSIKLELVCRKSQYGLSLTIILPPSRLVLIKLVVRATRGWVARRV